MTVAQTSFVTCTCSNISSDQNIPTCNGRSKNTIDFLNKLNKFIQRDTPRRRLIGDQDREQEMVATDQELYFQLARVCRGL